MLQMDMNKSVQILKVYTCTVEYITVICACILVHAGAYFFVSVIYVHVFFPAGFMLFLLLVT